MYYLIKKYKNKKLLSVLWCFGLGSLSEPLSKVKSDASVMLELNCLISWAWTSLATVATSSFTIGIRISLLISSSESVCSTT